MDHYQAALTNLHSTSRVAGKHLTNWKAQKYKTQPYRHLGIYVPSIGKLGNTMDAMLPVVKYSYNKFWSLGKMALQYLLVWGNERRQQPDISHLRPRIRVKYFLSFPQKNQGKLRQTKCLLFNFWVMKLTKTPILPNCQVPNGFFGITKIEN